MIYPKCKLKHDQVMAIRYDGYVIPCCHFGGWKEGKELFDFLGDKKEQIHITSGTVDEINRSEAYQMIEESFSSNPLPTCMHRCSDPINIDSNMSLSNSPFVKLKNEK